MPHARGLMGVVLATLLGMGLGGGAIGCTGKKPQPPAATSRPAGPPVMDGRRGGGSFPLEITSPPVTTQQLLTALDAGYASRLIPPTSATTRPATAITELTGELPSLSRLTIDVSDWHVRRDYEPREFGKGATEESRITIHKLAYLADPLKYERGSTRLRLEAVDADMLVLKDDRSDQRALVLAGAKRGTLRFSATMSEMRETLDYAARRGASRAGINLRSSDIQLSAPNPRTLDGVVTLKGTWLFLDMTLLIKGRMEVDDTMHANFSNISCAGQGPAGDLLAPFVNRALRRIDGRRSPLIAFRDEKTVARDFHLRADDTFEMLITFGR